MAINFDSAKYIKPGVAVIDNDAEVKLVLVGYERAQALQQHPDLPRLFITWADNEIKALFVVCRYSNFPDPKDNGLVCLIIDLKMYTPAEAAFMVATFQTKGSTGIGVPLHFVKHSRTEN